MINKTALWFVATVVTAFALKYVHTLSDTKDLLFILEPATKMAGAILHTTTPLDDAGYFFSNLNLHIGKSFSGGHFMIAAFVILSCTIPYHKMRVGFSILTFFGSVITSYMLTVIVTTIRITGLAAFFKLDNFIPWFSSYWFLVVMKVLLYLAAIYITYRVVKLVIATRLKTFRYTDHYPTF